MKFALQLVLLTTLLLGVESGHDALSYDFSTSLHASYNLYWNKPSGGEICMAVQVETLGWVGLGFSPNGGMIGSDIMMAWVIDGKVYITDRFALSESLPVLDEVQDFKLVEGYEEDGKTTIKFCRKLQTCDENDHDIVSETTRVIFSWNDNDPNSVPLKHQTKGTRSVNFIDSPDTKFSAADLPANTKTIEFKMGDFEVPINDTTYYCKSIRYNQPATKHHIIKIGIEVDPRTFDYVHHVVLYQCNGTQEILAGECLDSNGIIRTSGLNENCLTRVLNVWAVGGSDINFPPEAGLPIGPGEDFDTLVLEVHYNNPNLVAGLIDNSGFIWYYTETLRTHDLGIFYTGLPFDTALRIPPKTENYLIQAYCPKECTQAWQQDIYIIATMLHSHLAGRAIWTQIIRDNKEIGYLDMNRNYDFDYQEYLFYEEPIVLKPGDELILNCLYSTKDRENFTFGGPSTLEEMCFDFLFYYPKVVGEEYCISAYSRETSYNAAMESFQCNNIDVGGSTTHEELEERARDFEWTARISRTLEVSQNVPHEGVVAYCDGNSFSVNIPRPGVDYEVFPYRYDTCGKYNGTYYPGGEDADYYYDCDTNEPYFEPIGPTDSATSLVLLPVLMWMLATAVLSLF